MNTVGSQQIVSAATEGLAASATGVAQGKSAQLDRKSELEKLSLQDRQFNDDLDYKYIALRQAARDSKLTREQQQRLQVLQETYASARQNLQNRFQGLENLAQRKLNDRLNQRDNTTTRYGIKTNQQIQSAAQALDQQQIQTQQVERSADVILLANKDVPFKDWPQALKDQATERLASQLLAPGRRGGKLGISGVSPEEFQATLARASEYLTSRSEVTKGDVELERQKTEVLGSQVIENERKRIEEIGPLEAAQRSAALQEQTEAEKDLIRTKAENWVDTTGGSASKASPGTPATVPDPSMFLQESPDFTVLDNPAKVYGHTPIDYGRMASQGPVYKAIVPDLIEVENDIVLLYGEQARRLRQSADGSANPNIASDLESIYARGEQEIIRKMEKSTAGLDDGTRVFLINKQLELLESAVIGAGVGLTDQEQEFYGGTGNE
jgi:hypothetical protein